MIYVFCLNKTHRLIVEKPIPRKYVDRNGRREFKAVSASSGYSSPIFHVALPGMTTLWLTPHATHHEVHHQTGLHSIQRQSHWSALRCSSNAKLLSELYKRVLTISILRVLMGQAQRVV